MKQTGLVDRLGSAVEIDNNMARGNYKPTGSVPLVNNEDGLPASVIFNCSSAILIMLYLSGHTCPYSAFAFNCCSKYMFISIIRMKRLE